MTAHTTTLQKLAGLPPVFKGSEACLALGLDSKTLSQYLWRWTRADLIKPLGGKSDVYFNALLKPESLLQRPVAIHKAMPTAIQAGHAALMGSGVTTQFSYRDYLIVPPSARRFQIEHAVVHTRPRRWIERLYNMGGIVSGDLPSLTPGAALCDLVLFDRESVPDPDDIDGEMLEAKDKALMIEILGRDHPQLPFKVSRKK